MLIIWSLLVVAGIVFIYPLGAKYWSSQKKFWIPFGIVVSHIGLFGFFWSWINHFIFFSIVLFELGFLNFFNPLKIWPEVYSKKIRAVSGLFMIWGVFLSLSFFTDFAPWLWIFPLVLFLAPSVIPPLKPSRQILFMAGTTLVVIYLGIMGLRIYKDTWVRKANPPKIPAYPLVEKPQKPLEPGMVSGAIQEIDEKIKKLEEENERLKKEIKTLSDENKK